MAYDTTEAVAKFLSGFQMKITNRERDTVAPDYPFRGKRKKPPYRASLSRRTGKPPSM